MNSTDLPQNTAYQVIERHQTLKLSLEDSETFVEAVLNPQHPNEALKLAVLKYKQTIL